MKATINTYDVWGNERDGFEVNDTRKHLTGDFSGDINNDNDVLDWLNVNYFATPQTFNTIEFSADDVEFVEVSELHTGKPILEILFDGNN